MKKLEIAFAKTAAEAEKIYVSGLLPGGVFLRGRKCR